jgi:hypothetical protein
MLMTWILICTPKAESEINVPELVRKHPQFENIQIKISTFVYINQLAGWTEEECDDIAYIVAESDFLAGVTSKRYTSIL